MANTILQPAIVIAAWNRPLSLQRLLNGLDHGHFPAGTLLHISIDHFEYPEVCELADAFVWKFGEKVVEKHAERLGLRQHILHCGGLTKRYGSIILLEDDLGISPFAYVYAQKALDYFAEDEAIAGISLYCYTVAESCLQPFHPWMDQWDNWFLQLPSSWGAAFTAAQWLAFEQWLAMHVHQLPPLPDYVASWTAQSWKKLFTAYLIASNRYFSYPRQALTTNFEDFGAHANTKGLFQVPLMMGPRTWNFGRINDSLAVYDAHFEPISENLKRIAPVLTGYDFAVDLLGQKSRPFLDKPWVLTRRKGGKSEMGFAANALPAELNFHLVSPGEDFRLVPSNTEFEAKDDLAVEFGYYVGAAKTPLIHLPNRRMPSISLIALADADGRHAELLSYMLDEPFAGKELILVVESGKMPRDVWAAFQSGKIRIVESSDSPFEGIQKAIETASGQLIQVLSAEFIPATAILIKITTIFRQFPGLDWLTGIPFEMEGRSLSRVMAPLRWDTPRFEQANDAQIAAFLPFPLQIFRRSLWMKAIGEASTLEGQFKRMAAIALPQVTALEIGQWDHPRKEESDSIWGKGKVNKTRVFYQRHVPLLWKLHRRWSDYRPVLRYDAAHETWFEFDY
ncbi:MAG: hypothetical protein RLZZ519_1893 [Bacteroidota bacterium]|jgi:hypothetical protein